MRKVNFLILAVAVVFLNACKPEKPVSTQELVGKWNAEKYVFADGEENPHIEFIYMQFNADDTCVFNIEGLRDDDDVEANYSFGNNKIVLTIDDENLVLSVEKLTATELVINFPPLEEDEDSFTIYFKKAQ